ncbi:MAG: L-type lectin-domain containing protein, partial [Bacteroidota bacterium]
MYKLLSFIILSHISLAGFSQALFEINDFKAFGEDISLVAQSSLVDTKIRLTSAKGTQEGACWYNKSKIDLSLGFETEFTFVITEGGPSNGGGDGFAFIIQNDNPNVVGGTGDKIGYKDIPYVVAIEFDTYNNNEGSRNHINLSYWENNKRQYRRFATVHEIPEITDGKEHFTKIIYKDGIIGVYMDSYIFPLLTVQIDLAEKINAPDKMAWLGFT